MKALIIPGQGSQLVGMGSELYNNFNVVKNIFNEADNKLNSDPTRLNLMKYENIAFISSSTPSARAACQRLRKKYGRSSLDRADVVVVLGGDGTMLKAAHLIGKLNIPITGIIVIRNKNI